MMEFLAMGGYAWYVWMSYGAVAVVVAAEIVTTRGRLRRARTHAQHLSAAPVPPAPRFDPARST
jgi:heme exporter protein CcmD